MSNATFTFGRFNAPTEGGHGKLVNAVQAHAEKTGGKHYIFPSHSQDSKKNPLAHGEKVGFMRRLFPNANIVSQRKVKTAIDAMKHLESKGHTHVTMIVGSDRVSEFRNLLSKYREKEFPGIKKVEVKSAGNRDPDAEGAEGESASKHRALVAAGKREEFISKYSDKKLGADIHDAIKKGMQMESVSPIGIFLLGGPGSGKDYVLNNIFSRFDLTEVHVDQIINNRISELTECNTNIIINGATDIEKICLVKNILEGYKFDFVLVEVSNKVSRERNAERKQPLPENKRLEKWYMMNKLHKELDDCFVFNNSINLAESSEMEKILFGSQIEKLLERIVSHGLEMSKENIQKTFKTFVAESELKKVRHLPRSGNITKVMAKRKENELGEATSLPAKYKTGNEKTDAARAAHWKKMGKLSDRDPRAYKDAPGDKKARKEGIPLSPHTVAVRKMMAKEDAVVEAASDSSFAAKAKKSGISVGTLKKVYRRGVAAWNSGHRPGTTPQQWGHARVNSYINKGKTYHTADKDLREDINNSIEEELFNDCCPPELNEQSVDSTPTLKTNKPKKKLVPGELRKSELDGLPVASFMQYEAQRQIPAPPGGHPVPPGYERVRSWGGAYELRKIPDWKYQKSVIRIGQTGHDEKLKDVLNKKMSVKEAVEYHLENKISFTKNVFRPGSNMFFEMISEAKKLYKEGKYTTADEWEKDMLESDIGEIAEYEGQKVMLDYPIEEQEIDEGSDPTDGKGIGKPWREGGGGAVYVRSGDGGVKKVRFSQSGMTKKFNDPGATKSFMARHHCLTNKDKTSASYWACRYPRFFSNSGKIWW